MWAECVVENSIEISPEIKNPAVLLNVHIQKKQNRDMEKASALVCPSWQFCQENELTQ